MPNSDELVRGQWQVEIFGDETTVRTISGDLVATVHGTSEQQLRWAILIAAAPALRDAADATLTLMHLLVKHTDPAIRETAEDYIPVLETALQLTEPV